MELCGSVRGMVHLETQRTPVNAGEAEAERHVATAGTAPPQETVVNRLLT